MLPIMGTHRVFPAVKQSRDPSRGVNNWVGSLLARGSLSSPEPHSSLSSTLPVPLGELCSWSRYLHLTNEDLCFPYIVPVRRNICSIEANRELSLIENHLKPRDQRRKNLA